MERRSVVVTVNRTTPVTGMEGVPLDASALPFDPALPGLALLRRPAELTATLSRVLASWLGPDTHLRDSRASLRRLAPGKRCSIELELDTGRRYSFLGHLRTLAGWKELLAAVYPEGERLLDDLLGRFEERGRELSGWAPGPTHRDFSPEHLVVRGNQFTGLDFDEFCQYDPLFDVAHFVARLRFHGLTEAGALTRFDGLAQRFLARYEAGGGECSEERLRLYTAIAYFKLGRFVALVQRPQAWMRILPELLNEARRLV